MQIIYRVNLHSDCRVVFFDFCNIEQACKFADAAKIANADAERTKENRVRVTIDLLFKDEIEEDANND